MDDWDELRDGRESSLPQPVVKIFWCYDQNDRSIRVNLENHLSSLRRRGRIQFQEEQELPAGSDREETLKSYIDSSDLAILLVSADFLASCLYKGRAMPQILERGKREELTIVSVLVKEIVGQEPFLARYQVLPRNGKPLVRSMRRDQVYAEIAEDICEVVHRLLSHKYKHLGDVWHVQREYKYALDAYEKGVNFAVEDDLRHRAILHKDRGEMLLHLGEFEKALEACDEAIKLQPDFGDAYKMMGDVLRAYAPHAKKRLLQRAKEAHQTAVDLKRQKREGKGGHRHGS